MELGRAGEDAAARHYEASGYEVIARNWRCRVGEIDLILRRGGVLVFCEVKTRRGSGFGAGWEAVTARKCAKVRRVAEAFLLTARQMAGGPIRFDVASVSVQGSRTEVEVFADAF